MIRIKILNILENKNKSLNWLSMEAKIPYNTIWKLANNKTEGVKFEIINKICSVLDCRVGDIIEYIPDTDKN
ncbi:helix-turn-helix domain-containing protein [Paramaledivibacter caminithermalis]|jgi:putative transcriptional regulator|uniref:Putative transcriptional regulator n=1 Tax=Paramaledivibacter caminithermalis (strain DSM 15212 / CIP 107654 / DViRD3) TaxID=1121301 RepID=A0A1M6PEE7_PARC5|nr:helix-turn-helix transcriptional regulator [Paramaledivibacter caminithermalis]SHK06262.1 putative transcriptional regulator [Paramaledivibacter caminithermalis DSM 15212]